MSMRNKRSALLGVCLLIVLALFLAVVNIPTSIVQGVNGVSRELRMPLYAKWVEFLARHYEYRRIAAEITGNAKTDTEKAVRIAEWTHDTIKAIPPGMPLVDDHIYHIIVRGYGNDEQVQDVFTTLCVYAGIPAYWVRVSHDNGKGRVVISLVRIGGKWTILDPYTATYYRMPDGSLASVDDILAGRAMHHGLPAVSYQGVPFSALEAGIRRALKSGGTLRAEKQMPAKRMIFEMTSLLGSKEKARVDY
jgi:hypothetical protein